VPSPSPGTLRPVSLDQPPGAAAVRCMRDGTCRAAPEAPRGCSPPGAAPASASRVWWKRSILPWVCGCPGDPFFWRIPSQASRYSKLLRPPVKRDV
jgi:hypothetical protein